MTELTARDSRLETARSTSAFNTSVEAGIAVLTLDLPGEPVNKLNAAVKRELESLLPRLREDPAFRGLVLISG